MGWLKDAKAEAAAKHAARALEEGHRVLLMRIDVKSTSGDAEMIEAVEDVGFTLDKMTGYGQTGVLLLFRRA